ncbi:protein bottleneck [Drosophila tropicalis]|uniref:protein bottleneck n=1 Tax=Drosophila tropicalis TaxID=46794 RepID=UPI0035AC28E4
MSISTFNFQFYNYKLPTTTPNMGSSTTTIGSGSSFISELEMDIDDDGMSRPSITSTPKPRFTSEITRPAQPAALQALRPQLHTPQKRWSMELREKVLEMSKRNNGSDGEEESKPQQQLTSVQLQGQGQAQAHAEAPGQAQEQGVMEEQSTTRSVSDKINFFNKLTNTFESLRPTVATATGHNNNCFISLLRSSRPMNIATTNSNASAAIGQVPPPKPKRLSAAPVTGAQFPFATPTPISSGMVQRKCSLRRKPSMEKSSRSTIARQNSNASMRPQRHAMMEDLSLVVPVRLRIAEYEQRISMSA